MDEITLILIGLTFLFFAFNLFHKADRNVNLAGATFGICALAALLLEPWTDYTMLILMPVIMAVFMLIGGGISGDVGE